MLKPGSAEPWTPYRVIQAFVAGRACPPEAFGFYPTDHAGAGEILRRCGRGMVFGDVASTAPWQADPRVEVHGPGYSKVVLGPDASADWEQYLDVMASSIVENGGRSCINASGVWVTANAREIAEALAARLAAIAPRAPRTIRSRCSRPSPTRRSRERISAMIDRELEAPGAEDVTARLAAAAASRRRGSCTYLLPTVVLLRLARAPARQPRVPVPVRERGRGAAGGDRRRASAPRSSSPCITADQALLARILASPLVAPPEPRPDADLRSSRWDQPHEGNLFEHLYVRRALLGRAGVA